MDELQQLKHFTKLADAYEDSLPKEKPIKKKREPKTEMLSQTQLPADGPALFMGGGKRVSVTLQGYTVRMRLWDWPRAYRERQSKRVVRLRRGLVPRGTST